MDLFIEILNLSLVSSYVIVFVLIARLLLKKAPKIYSYMLWIIVFVRLSCSFTIESPVGLIPENQPIKTDIIYQSTAQINTQFNKINIIDIETIPQIKEEKSSITQLQSFMNISGYIWILGVGVMLSYNLYSYIKLKRNLVGSMTINGDNVVNDRIYISDYITSPFVIDVIKPKIYLPSDIKSGEIDFIIAHEKTHIKRLDHITRVIAFFILSIHWFNPLVWIAYILSGRDMELSCDESVIKQTNADIRKEYSQSLLNFTVGRVITPSFGVNATIDTKERIKNIMNFKRPVVWVSALAITSVSLVTIGCMSSVNGDTNPPINVTSGQNEVIIYDQNNPRYTIEIDDIILSTANKTPLFHSMGDSMTIFLENVELSIAGKEIYLGEENEGQIVGVDSGDTIEFGFRLNTDINRTDDYDANNLVGFMGEDIFYYFTFNKEDDTISVTEKAETTGINPYFASDISIEDIQKFAMYFYEIALQEPEETMFYDTSSHDEFVIYESETQDNQRYTIGIDNISLTTDNKNILTNYKENSKTLFIENIDLFISGKEIYVGEENEGYIKGVDLGDNIEVTFHLTTDINREKDGFIGEELLYTFLLNKEDETVSLIEGSQINPYFASDIAIEDIQILTRYILSIQELDNLDNSDDIVTTKDRDITRITIEQDNMSFSNNNNNASFNSIHINSTIMLEKLELNIDGKDINLGEENYGYIYVVDYDDVYDYDIRLFTDINMPTDYDPLLGELSGESIYYNFVINKADDKISLINDETSDYFNDILTLEDIAKFTKTFYEYALNETPNIPIDSDSIVEIELLEVN